MPDPIWVRIEIGQIRASGGHLYIEAVERSEGASGRQVAKSQAIIWSSLVTRLVKKFSSATGMELGKGIQVLVLVKPEIHPQYGLSLQITDIDPAFTLGDMAARLQKIREDLAACGDARRNIELPTPDDFVRVGVVSPAAAGGLEDFQAGAAVLASAGLCSFTYFEAIFQGEKAKESIKAALIAAHAANQQAPFDALVIIRGGGATADLHWLDEFMLARLVCRFHVPVFTGIGHERDLSILDECANRSFGTPSKVIAHIRAAILAKASTGLENWTTIAHSVSAALDGADVRSDARMAEIGAGAERRVVNAAHVGENTFGVLKTAAGARLQDAGVKTLRLQVVIASAAGTMLELVDTNAAHAFSLVGAFALTTVGAAAKRADHEFSSVTLAARRSIDGVDLHLDDQQRSIAGSAAGRVAAAEEACTRDFADVRVQAGKGVQAAERSARELMSGIMAQGIAPTLQRGFAMVRSPSGPVSTMHAARSSSGLELVFRDGAMPIHKGRTDE